LYTVSTIIPSKRLRILLAEDEYIYQRVIEKYIHDFDMQLTIVEDGEECLEKIERQEYDIILMDIVMPNLNGLETTQAIRKKGIDTPIIAVTSNTWKEDEEMSIDSGMNDFLPKPFNAQKLVKKITYWSKKNRSPATGKALQKRE